MANIPLTFGHPQQNPNPAPLACLECRRKHLKCDGVQPACGRCLKSQVTCRYTPSRRGRARESKPQSTRTSPSAATSDAAARQQPVPSAHGIPANPFGPSPYPPVTPSGTATVLDRFKQIAPVHAAASDPGVLSPPEHMPLHDGDRFLLDFYYAFFHESHPILPPAHLLQRFDPLPPFLETVLKFIGAHYTPNVPPDSYREAALAAFAAVVEPTFYEVQALLLFSVALHARNERADASGFFSNAVNLSLKLDMNRQFYAEIIGGDDRVKVESVRRTWWELYIIDSLLAAFDQTRCRIDKNVVIDVPLPCNDGNYSAELYVDDPVTATQFYDRIFRDDNDDEQSQFSSYAYVIEAAHILQRVLLLPQSTNDDLLDLVESLDASIESWFRHLPESKTHVLGRDGEVNQDLFRAYMIVHCASIYLHLPRSNLLSTATASAAISCVLHDYHAPPASTRLVHATKAIKAANGLATLATLRSSVSKHTPFFICALVLGAVVQLCAGSTGAAVSPIESRRDRLALMIGELKMLSGTWAISRRVMQQVKALAREVMEIGVPHTSHHAEIGDGGPDISSLVYDERWLGDIPTT